jgi:hypothetical protein
MFTRIVNATLTLDLDLRATTTISKSTSTAPAMPTAQKPLSAIAEAPAEQNSPTSYTTTMDEQMLVRS